MGREKDTVLQKAALRRLLVESRRKTPFEERLRRSALIWEHLRGLTEFRQSPLLCSFVGFGEEVETAGELRGALNSRRRVAVPTTRAPGGGPAFSEILDWDELSANSLGILEPEPQSLRLIPTGEIPLFLVPGVAFDDSGGRLGYGLGFYDRALSGASADSLIVGLAFELQIVDRVPVAAHDHPVDLIVTENRIFETSLKARSTEEVC